MKTLLLLLVTVAAFSAAWAHPTCITTVCLRWQEPGVDSPTPAVGVTATELQKAIRILNRAVHSSGVDVHFGYFPAEHPSTDPGAIGRLWIGGVPLEELIAPSAGSPTVSAEQIARAGKLSADKLLIAVRERHEQKLAGRSPLKSATETGELQTTGSSAKSILRR